MARTIFTFADRTEKKYTIGQAYAHARAVLNAKGYPQVCINKISGADNNTKITLEQMSDLVEEMVQDTYFYDGWKYQGNH